MNHIRRQTFCADAYAPDAIVFLLVRGFYFPQPWVATYWRDLASDCKIMLQQSSHEAECASALCEDELVSCWHPHALAGSKHVEAWRRMQAADLRWLGKLSVYTELNSP